MNDLITLINDWAATWSGAMLRASWIGGLVVLIAWTITKLFPQVPIFARSWIWRLVYLKVLVVLFWVAPLELPFLPASLSRIAPLQQPTTTTVHSPHTGTRTTDTRTDKLATTAVDHGIALQIDSQADSSVSLLSYLFGAWIVGVLVCAGCIARNWLRMQKLCATSMCGEDDSLNKLRDSLCEQLGYRSRPRLVVVNATTSPQLVGLVRPTILVPRSLENSNAANLRMVLAHELAHWKRRDLQWNLLPALVGSLFYFHPAVWLAQREWRLAQELACDETAMQVAQAPRDTYGRMLLEIARMYHANWQPSLLSIGVSQSFHDLSRRIKTMKSYRSASRLRITTVIALLTIVAVFGIVPWRLTARETAPAPPASEATKNESLKAQAASDQLVPTNLPGRIYVTASLRRTDENGESAMDRSRLIAIDPNTGKWEKLPAKGDSLRVSHAGDAFALENEDKVWVSKFNSEAKPLLIGNIASGRPVWSPDGKEIVVSEQKTNDEWDKPNPTKPVWTDETWRYSVDGSKKEWLPLPSSDGVDDWSPDGKWFVTCSDRHRAFGSGYQLYLVSPDGTQQRRLTQGPGLNCYARFSPDSKQVAFTHQRRKTSIRTITVADGKETIVAEQDGANGVEAACWSPDGKYLAILRFDWEVGPDGKYFKTADHDSNYRFEIVSLDGKERREIKLQDADVRFMGHADWK